MTLAALGEVFEAARGIMSWLGDCAKVAPFVTVCWIPNDAISPTVYFWHFSCGLMHVCNQYLQFCSVSFLEKGGVEAFYRLGLSRNNYLDSKLLVTSKELNFLPKSVSVLICYRKRSVHLH